MSVQKFGDYWKEAYQKYRGDIRDEQLRKTSFDDNVQIINTRLKELIDQEPRQSIDIEINDKLGVDIQNVHDYIIEYTEYYKINHDIIVTLHKIEDEENSTLTMRFRNPVW